MNIDVNSPVIQALHKRAPYIIEGVSNGMFSVARYYGAATFNGDRYTYDPEDDVLVRDDVLKAWARLKRRKEKVTP